MAVVPGPRENKAGYVTNNFKELRVKRRGLERKDYGRVSTGLLETEHGLQKTEKEGESNG